MTRYTRLTDEQLRDKGWPPEWIEEEDELEGPYHPASFSGPCRTCGHEGHTVWSVVNVATGIGIGEEYHGHNAQCDAEETANELNGVWLEGYGANG